MSQPDWRAQVVGGTGGRAPSIGWIFGTSSWLLLVFFPGGGLAWLGFLIIGLILLRPTWLLASVAYGTWALVNVFLANEAGGMLSIGLLAITVVIHGLIANRRLLRTIWGRIERGETWWGAGAAAPLVRITDQGVFPEPAARQAPARRSPVDVPREAEELLSAPGTSRSDYFADAAPVPAAAAQLPPPRGQRRSGPPPAPSRASAAADAPAIGSTETVDVNTATVEEFRTVPGFTLERARSAVAARERRTRFASVQEFADDLGLQPHELARMRDRLTCSRRRPSSFGRRVDL